MAFPGCLTDCKATKVSRTLLSILVDLNNAVVWTVSTRLVISKSSSPCTNPLDTATGAPITIGIIITIIIIIYSLEIFTSALADCLSLEFVSDSTSPQVSRTLLSIFNNVVVWMVSSRPPTSKSSCAFSNPLITVPNAPITIGIIVTCMFHNFFNSLARSRYLSFFSHLPFRIYHLFVWLNLNFLHISQQITLPT